MEKVLNTKGWNYSLLLSPALYPPMLTLLILKKHLPEYFIVHVVLKLDLIWIPGNGKESLIKVEDD